jgi:nitrogen fixation protein NifQ
MGAAMIPDDSYSWLIAASQGSDFAEFDTHVLASIIAVALSEAGSSPELLCDGVGLDGDVLLDLIAEYFPGALPAFVGLPRERRLTIDMEEQSVRDILLMYSTKGSRIERLLVAMIARRCMRPNHLWQDLGLHARTELSQLMQRHFATLAQRNKNDMKWKKFLYRMVCGSEGFSLCSTPVCSECDDFAACFGAEDGESLLARARLAEGKRADADLVV